MALKIELASLAQVVSQAAGDLALIVRGGDAKLLLASAISSSGTGTYTILCEDDNTTHILKLKLVDVVGGEKIYSVQSEPI